MKRVRADRDYARRHVRTGTAGSSLLLTLVWIVFTEVSSSRSAAIWCSGAIFSMARAGAGYEAASDAAASINLGVLVNLAFITRGFYLRSLEGLRQGRRQGG